VRGAPWAFSQINLSCCCLSSCCLSSCRLSSKTALERPERLMVPCRDHQVAVKVGFTARRCSFASRSVSIGSVGSRRRSSHCMPHVTPRWVSSAGARWKSRDPLECPSTTRPARRGMSPPRPGKRATGDLWAFGMRIVSQPIPRTLSGERVSAIALKNKAKPKRLGKQRDWLTISGVNPLTLWRGSGTPSCDRGQVYAPRLPLRFCDQLLVHGRDGAAKGAPDRAGATGGHRDGERALVLILLDPISSSAS
jgi:hypothetical protein